MAVYGGIPQSRVSQYEPYTPGTDFGAWRQKNPLRVAMPGTVGATGVRKPMSMFYPQTPSRMGPRIDPNRIIEPADMQFRPQTPTPIFEPRVPTPIEPPFEQQTPTPIETPPPFEPQTPTPIEPPFEPQVPTPIEPTSAVHSDAYNFIREGHIHIPEIGVVSLKQTAAFPNHLAKVLLHQFAPPDKYGHGRWYGMNVLDYLRQKWGDASVRVVLQRAGLNPDEFFEQPSPQTPEPMEPRVEPTPRRF